MSQTLQVASAIACSALFFYVIHLVKRRTLQLRYSLLWLALSIAVLISSLFPVPLFQLSQVFGFTNASNFIFFCGALFLLVIVLNLSSIVSLQATSIKGLTQKIALLEYEMQREKNSSNMTEG